MVGFVCEQEGGCRHGGIELNELCTGGGGEVEDVWGNVGDDGEECWVHCGKLAFAGCDKGVDGLFRSVGGH